MAAKQKDAYSSQDVGDNFNPANNLGNLNLNYQNSVNSVDREAVSSSHEHSVHHRNVNAEEEKVSHNLHGTHHIPPSKYTCLPVPPCHHSPPKVRRKRGAPKEPTDPTDSQSYHIRLYEESQDNVPNRKADVVPAKRPKTIMDALFPCFSAPKADAEKIPRQQPSNDNPVEIQQLNAAGNFSIDTTVITTSFDSQNVADDDDSDNDETGFENPGYSEFSILLSDEEDEDPSKSEICKEICCNPSAKEDGPRVHGANEQDAFKFNENDSVGIILQKHDYYLTKLKETDKRLNPILPIQLLSHACKCGQRCDALLSIQEICKLRIAWPLLYHDRISCQFYIIKTLMVDNVFMPHIKNNNVCLDFFCAVNVIPLERATRFVTLINDGIDTPIHANTGRRFQRETTVENLARLAMYIDDNFEANPAKNAFLPSSRMTKCTAAGEALNIPQNIRRKKNFTKLFKAMGAETHFVSGNSLTKCNICTEYSFKLRKTSLPDEEKAKLRVEWEAHKVKIRNDRLDYKFRCILSTEKPGKYCSIVHDGMCKAKSKLPLNNDHRSKKIEDNDRMFCGLNLAIVHQKSGSSNTRTVGFFSPASCYDNTTNAIISQLLFTLSTLPIIPPTVFIQIDNFPGNKSYLFFAAFGYLLLRQKAIREFYVSFMMPGHTHCDVDARFGNFSTYLNGKECGSPQELMTSFLECIPGEAHMKQSIYNFKEVLTPHCYNYGKLKSMYDFHLYVDSEGVPMVENARFELSETLLCGSRQKQDSFVSKIFKKPPPLDLQFALVMPKLEGIDKMIPNIPKWEKVITATAKSQLQNLKEEIRSHVGIPFASLLHTIQDKVVPVDSLQMNDAPDNLMETSQ